MIYKYFFLLIIILSTALSSCTGQTKENTIMNSEPTKTNPLLCDPATGVCELPTENKGDSIEADIQSIEKTIKVLYFTDPICSSCWGIEPQLRKLKLAYGDHLEIEYKMGGLLPNWNYNSGGISKPSDVAHHWDEVSLYYDMPIDGDIWLEDPLDSSYPPSIAFKAAQMQDNNKATLFLREMREMVFLEKKNIAKWEYIEIAGNKAGLDIEQLKLDYNGKAKILFENDLKLAQKYGVRGFPTIFFVNNLGVQETVYGSQPYQLYENTILKLNSQITKSEYQTSWKTLFSKYKSLTRREFSELSGATKEISEQVLNDLSDKGILLKLTTKNGSIWRLKSID
jgi:predicted DsbA family dithiol-disulfide isomerase